MSIRLVVVWLLSFSLLLSGCNDTTKQQDKQASETGAQAASEFRPPRDAHGRYADIGNLGGKALAIPGSVILVGWVHYAGDPNDFDFTKEAKAYRKKRRQIKNSYDRVITGFAFDMRVTDGVVRDFDQPTYMGYNEDSREHASKGEPMPWTFVKVEARGDRPLNFNSFLESSMTSALRKPDYFNYQLQPKTVEGLLYYQPNNGIDPETNEPWGEYTFGKDIFVQKDQQDNVNTMIICEISGHVRFCRQWFIKPDMKAQVALRYDRRYLSQWRKLEQYATQALDSWVVEKPQQEGNHHKAVNSVN
ncbi:hypothetical protein PT286_07965 [Neisseriaceae bacterium ESL0693]|nr:hypothetical protein [Neisseriaceae bacterium ESL0693]